MNDVIPGSDELWIWGFEKKQLVEIWAWTNQVDFSSRRGETSWDLRNVLRVCLVSESRADDVQTVSIVRHCVSLSPHVEKP